MAHKSLKHVAHHIDKSLRFRLRIYFAIAVILIGVFFFNVIRGTLHIQLGLLGMAIGIILGVITSRMYNISWSHDMKKVIGRLDLFGIIILIFYLAIELSRDKIIAYFTNDFEVVTIGFAVLAGIMLGRVIGTRGKILQVLKEQEIF